MFETAPGEDTERAVAVRNPYYFKVDTEGTQLPHFDKVVYQMVAIPMFQNIGIDAQIRTMDRSLWETRVCNGREFDASAHQFGANGGIAAMLDARYLVPFNRNAIYAAGWALYFSDPDNADAIEPPAPSRPEQFFKQ